MTFKCYPESGGGVLLGRVCTCLLQCMVLYSSRKRVMAHFGLFSMAMEIY